MRTGWPYEAAQQQLQQQQLLLLPSRLCGQALTAYQRLKAFYRCVTRLANEWPTDVREDQEYVPQICVPKLGVLADPDAPHEPWLVAEWRGFCPRCRSGSRSTKKRFANRFFRGCCNLGRTTQGGRLCGQGARRCQDRARPGTARRDEAGAQSVEDESGGRRPGG